MEERQTIQSIPGQRAFTALYREYYKPVFAFVVSFVKSSDVAEDITQDLFLYLISKNIDTDQIENFKSYLFTAAKNRTLNYLKKMGHDSQAKETLLRHYSKQHASLENDQADLEYQQHLNKHLQQLSVQNQAVFKLCRQEGKTYEQAAQLLGISTSAVKKHMVKSMKMLKLALKKDFDLIFAFLISIL